VDLMAAVGQRVRKLGGDATAAAHRRVADHADVQGMSFSSQDR
jgi:hypothetical protein